MLPTYVLHGVLHLGSISGHVTCKSFTDNTSASVQETASLNIVLTKQGS